MHAPVRWLALITGPVPQFLTLAYFPQNLKSELQLQGIAALMVESDRLQLAGALSDSVRICDGRKTRVIVADTSSWVGDCWGAAVDSRIEFIRIENLETRLGLRRLLCLSLELELECAKTDQEKSILRRSWVEAIRGCVVLNLALELLKRQQEPSAFLPGSHSIARDS